VKAGNLGGRKRVLLTSHLLLLTACSVAPLTNKIKVGEEPFVIGVGEGSDGLTDLYAARASGGNFYRVTFNRGEERLPRLSPEGTRVAFLRRTTAGDPWSLVVLNLQNNREASTPLPRAIGDPESIGWSRDGAVIAIRGFGSMVTPAPPLAFWLRGVPLDSVRWADSVTSELLGDPPSARIAACAESPCVISGSDTTRLEVTGPIRWGADSLGYFGASGWEIRPLAGGRSRRPDWKLMPAHLREISYFRGQR
jgi:hypothetical protein